MAGVKLVATTVLLLLSWGIHQTSAQGLSVSIAVERTDPPGFTPGNSTEYRAASGPQIVTCTATGGSGTVSYQWTSTCRDCPFLDSTDRVISRAAVTSGHTGTHTCTVTSGGESASANIVFSIVGAGIHDFSISPFVSLPNNGLIVFRNIGNGFRLRLFCRSDSMIEPVGQLIGLDETVITTNSFFDINNPQPGEVTIENTAGSQDALPSSEQGVYTCRIPLQNGTVRNINVGIYPIGFNTLPTINIPPVFTLGSSSSTLMCTSTGSPATTVTFIRGSSIIGPLRDGESVTVSGVSYQLTQAVTNRTLSTYQSTLIINQPITDIVDSTFTCNVVNLLGSAVSQPITIRGLSVSIAVERTDLPGFTPGDSTEYRAASGPQIVTCTATGGSGTVSYLWSSTCRDCPFQGSTDRVISRTAVNSGDTGTHTCTATSGGETASANIVFSIVGAGIHDFSFSSSASLPNNGLIVFRNIGSGFRLRLFCRSDSMIEPVGQLIGLDETVITTNSFFDINNPQPGEVTIENTAGSQDALPSSEQGVYTCRIPLQNGTVRDINVGIYPIGFNTLPTINIPPVFTLGSSSSTLMCTSTGSPATTVTFIRGSSIIGPLRDGESVTVSGVSYQLTQAVTNRTLSTYQNTLIINQPITDIVDSTFACNVVNLLGSAVSQPIIIRDIDITSPSQPLTVGESASFTCTSRLGLADVVQWFLVDGMSETLQVMNTGETTLDLVLGPVSDCMDGSRYRCRVTIGGSSVDRDVTLSVQVDPAASTSSDSTIAIVAGVLGGVVALLLAYSILTSIVIVVMHHRRHAGVQHEMEQPVKWSKVTKLEDSDIMTSECVAYGKAQQLPPVDSAQDTTYEEL